MALASGFATGFVPEDAAPVAITAPPASRPIEAAAIVANALLEVFLRKLVIGLLGPCQLYGRTFPYRLAAISRHQGSVARPCGRSKSSTGPAGTTPVGLIIGWVR